MNGEDYYKSNLTGPMVIVVGAEGKGLGRLVKEKCDIIVSLPMQGGVSSLNASAAGAVLLYEVVRQRRVAGGRLKYERMACSGRLQCYQQLAGFS